MSLTPVVVAVSVVLFAVACAPAGERDAADSAATPASTIIVVYNAGSLARPLRAALDTFAARHGLTVQQENAGSLETARKLTELGKIPDVIALADYEVFPQLLMPEHVRWYVQFARNRMILAYTDRSRGASEITSDNWWQILQRPDVAVGRSDPNLDPAGYRALLAMRLAERHYRQPGLEERLLRNSPPRYVRPKASDLVALAQAGELDYVWEYESVAQAANLPFVILPHEIDLSLPADSALYAQVSVRVAGKSPGDTIEMRGQPIVYGLSIPEHAPHRAVAERFIAWLLTDEGKGILRAAKLDALERPVLAGTGVPASVAAAVGATP